MKSIASAFGAVTLATLATPAFAAVPPPAATNSQPIDIVGTAEAFCTLPTSWAFAASSSNVNASSFTGTTWTIPATLLADAEGNGAVSMDDVSIRIRGQAVCNTSHILTLTSVNGGLVHSASSGSPPPGFQRSRRMSYDAYWRDQPTWGITNWIPQSAGDSKTYDHGATMPPGIHDFDIRMGLLREPTSGPMVAGGYMDELIITITVPS